MKTVNVFKRNFTTWVHRYLDSQTIYHTCTCALRQKTKKHSERRSVYSSKRPQSKLESRVSRIFYQLKIISSLKLPESVCVSRLFIDEESWTEKRISSAVDRGMRTNILNHARQSEGRGTRGLSGSFLSGFLPKWKAFALRHENEKRTSAHSFIEMESSWWWCCWW